MIGADIFDKSISLFNIIKDDITGLGIGYCLAKNIQSNTTGVTTNDDSPASLIFCLGWDFCH